MLNWMEFSVSVSTGKTTNYTLPQIIESQHDWLLTFLELCLKYKICFYTDGTCMHNGPLHEASAYPGSRLSFSRGNLRLPREQLKSGQQ